MSDEEKSEPSSSDDSGQEQVAKAFEDALKESVVEEHQPIPNLMEHMRKLQQMRREMKDLYEEE